MLETDVWKHFKATWPYYCERQEDWIKAGQPDVCLWDKNGMRGLVELKRPDKIVLRTSQWIWHEQDQIARGRSCVVTCFNHVGKIKWKVFAIDAAKRELKQIPEWSREANGNGSLTGYDMIMTVAKKLNLRI